MRNRKLKTLTSASLASILVMVLNSCGANEDSSDLKNSTVTATARNQIIELGYGYSEKTGALFNQHCVAGTKISSNSPETGGKVEFIADASYESIVRSLNGSIDASINLGAITGSAGAEIAKDVASSELSTNLYAYINLIGKSEALSAIGRSYAPNVIMPGVNPEKYCGTDFVSQIDYGASMAVTLEITSKSKKQRDKIAGYLNANLAMIEAKGKLSNIDIKDSEAYKIRLQIKQIGGVPQNVSLAIPADGLYCDIASIQSCIGKMNSAIAYMNGQMRSDLSQMSNWNPLTYHTTSYSETQDVAKLAPQRLSFEQQAMLEKAHDLIKEEYNTVMSDWKDAETILHSFDLEDKERATMKSTLKTIIANANALDRVVSKCTQDYDFCMEKAANTDAIGITPYDRQFRKLGFERRAKQFCASNRQAALLSGQISEDEVKALVREESVPMFSDPSNSSSTVIGFEPCWDGYERSLSI